MIKANPSPKGNGFAFNLFGDPYGNRTHDTTVKGWCLNRLTKGPRCFRAQTALPLYFLGFAPFLSGSGGQIRTTDLPGMNRPL